MLKRVAMVIEIVTFVALVLLAVRWASTQNGWFEPYTVICGCVFIGIELYRRHLAKDETGGRELASNEAAVSDLRLSDKARDLLLNATRDASGLILMFITTSGLSVQTNNRQFAENRNARSEAEWKAAVEDLLEHGFVESVGERGESFQVTAKGYSAVDSLGEGRSESGQSPKHPVLPPVALEILRGAVAGKIPINVVRYDGGFAVVTGERPFDSDFDPERAAQLEDAVMRLAQAGWIKEAGDGLFHVTQAGFEAEQRLQGDEYTCE
jgi:hypothetical protein